MHLPRQLLARKSIDQLIRESEEPEKALKKSLGPWSLTALGIGARAEQLAARHPGEAASLRAALARLTEPEAMGTLFKALALLPAAAATAPGFEEAGAAHEAA